MEIIETVPIYGPPLWPIIIVFIGLGLMVLSIATLANTEYVGIIVAVIASILMLGGLISLFILRESEFEHNEYIVRITDISTQEFVEKYEVTKRFEYSDAIQVREIEK